MTETILLTGGTGTLGRLLTPRLLEAGHQLRVLSRQQHVPAKGVEFVRGDLATGEGAAAAVDGVATIVHCAGSPKGDDVKTRHLIEAASGSSVRHLVYISVVGADRVPVVSSLDRAMFGYFAAKRASEQLVLDSGIPWTILRATQFHEAMLTATKGMSKLPIIPVPAGIRFQPIAGEEVAERLAALALGHPAGLVSEMGGPHDYGMDQLVRSYLKATGRHRLVMPMRLVGKAARAHREGANLTPQHAVGRQTWEQFLADRLREPGPDSR